MINDKRIARCHAGIQRRANARANLCRGTARRRRRRDSDDASRDDTAQLARELGIEHVIIHDRNPGYGGNQKTCYRTALAVGADIVIMVHPDYQCTPKLIRAMASLIAEDVFP